jgi:hypothetical protein
MSLLCHLLSLLLLVLTAVVASAEIPLPSLKDALQRIHAKHEEASRRNQDRISRVLSHVRADDQPVERNLQTQTPALCIADESKVSGTDAFGAVVFGGAQFDTNCTCAVGTSTVVAKEMNVSVVGKTPVIFNQSINQSL